jgi:glycine/D-amino acid oxidase-like deaminating enzyme
MRRLTGAANKTVKRSSGPGYSQRVPSAIVIGAGVFGASLADRLACEGWGVTLVDAFEPGHARAESGGETRLIRCAHGPDGFYARSARRAMSLWRELGEGVLVESGVVWFARREDGWEADSERVLSGLGIPVSRLDPAEAARMFPSLAVDDLAFVLHEPEAGVLRASAGVRALVRRAQANGARLELGAARPDGARVRLGERVLEADAVVWACGAWLGRLFPDVAPLRVTLQQLVLFEAGPEWDGPGWVDFDAAFYGHARVEPFGFKVGPDADGPDTDPDTRPLEAEPDAIERARSYLAQRFPGLAGARVASAPGCHYGLTPDGEFVFAPHPEHPGVWLLGGGSGHGYKHGPALAEHVGAVLAGREQPEPRFALGERAPARSLRTAGAETP